MDRNFVSLAVMALVVAPTVLMAQATGAGASAANRPTTRPATTQAAKIVEREDLIKRMGDLPAIGPYEMSQVLQIHLQDKRVVVSSPLESFDGERLVKFKHPDDLATIHFHAMGASSAPDQPRFIQLYRYDFRDPKVVFFHTAVLSHPGYAQVAGSWQYLEGMMDVSIIDQEERVDDAGGQVPANITLRVQGLDDDGNVTHKVELSAADLSTLQRQHPAEVNQYLRPVLRELGAEAIINIDPQTAWQVFAAEARPDPAVAAKVKELLPKLDAANFQEREQAAGAMKKLGTAGAIVMLQLDRSKLSAEQNSRLDEILAPYQQLDRAQVARMGDDMSFLLNALDSDDAEIRRIALARLDKKVGHAVAFDEKASPEARHAAVDELREKLMPPATTQASEKAQS